MCEAIASAWDGPGCGGRIRAKDVRPSTRSAVESRYVPFGLRLQHRQALAQLEGGDLGAVLLPLLLLVAQEVTRRVCDLWSRNRSMLWPAAELSVVVSVGHR
jgi:hypothetical protein